MVMPRVQRLERMARVQLGRLYEETRRVGASTVAMDRRAVDRVHELMSLTRDPQRPRRRRETPG